MWRHNHIHRKSINKVFTKKNFHVYFFMFEMVPKMNEQRKELQERSDLRVMLL